MAKQPKRQLPKIAELRSDVNLEVLDRQNSLNILLNEEPNEAWIRINKYAGNARYIPINRLEWLMSTIFVDWHTEVLSVQCFANAVMVTVRVHYRNPVTGMMEWNDGVGAAGLQTDKGEAATNFMALKQNAMDMGLPKAKTEAVKDAIGDLGRLFGRDLNRKDAPDYAYLMSLFPAIDESEIGIIEAQLAPHGEEYRAQLLDFLGVQSVAEIPKAKFKSALSRINERTAN